MVDFLFSFKLKVSSDFGREFGGDLWFDDELCNRYTTPTVMSDSAALR